MDFLGIGPLEILFILVIALIIFGPKDIVKASQSAGRFLRKLIMSPGWQAVQQTSRDLRSLPNKLIREAGMEDIQKDMSKDMDMVKEMAKPPDLNKEIKAEIDQIGEGLSAWTSTPPADINPAKTKPGANEAEKTTSKTPDPKPNANSESE